MTLDPILPVFVAVILFLVAVGLIAHLIRQPPVIGFLLAGILIGPQGLGVVTDGDFMSRLGNIGVVLLLFFVGMEVSPQRLARNWKLSLIGTGLQVGLSVAVAFALGAAFGWSTGRSLLIGFVISMSSTAVILKLLRDWGELDSAIGQDILGITLVQDLAAIPMLIAIGTLAGSGPDSGQVLLQVLGALGLLALAVAAVAFAPFRIPFSRFWKGDHEMQVLVALAVCFGLSLISGLLQLSTALGAFVAGLVLHATEDTDWVERSLQGFRAVFMAAFFLSVGMLLDFSHLAQNWLLVLLLVGAVLIINTVINTLVLRAFGRKWGDSFYGGAVLAQIGEFSFVLAAVGLQVAMITDAGYQITISIITLSLMVSPLWISLMKILVRRRAKPRPEAPQG